MPAATPRPLTAQRDVPDLRDRMYEPPLCELAPEIDPRLRRGELEILDQGQEGACTGFALAAAINLLDARRGGGVTVSPRMLYEMALRHDEWPGEGYDGSSLRGAIRGWRHMGVCTEKAWPYREKKTSKDVLTVARAKDGRSNTLGAYYRLRPEVSDFHAALNEIGIIAVSAQVHRGWNDPKRGRIEKSSRDKGGHAFAIVGYDAEGFWVQNSWGEDWGDGGLALWTYEDWIENVMDAWVVQLALPTPQIFGARPKSSLLLSCPDVEAEGAQRASIARREIAGHFAHIDDGAFAEHGRYWSNEADVRHTAELVAASEKYDHLLVYAHGGLNSPEDSAARIAAMRDGFKRNRIYPYHLMYDTGLAEELRDVIAGKGRAGRERVGGFRDWLDRLLERILRRPGTLVWEEMKRGARVAFENRDRAGTRTLRAFTKSLRASPPPRRKRIHLAGHSTGAILLAHLLHAFRSADLEVASCSLMAPACTIDLFANRYVPALTGRTKLRLQRLDVYALRDDLEQADDVAALYGKSLLYLVSNAFERWHDGESGSLVDAHGDPVAGRPLLGMELYSNLLPELSQDLVAFHHSNGRTGATRARSHGGFDNDPHTMNHILETILGHRPSAAARFTERELRF